MDLVNVFFSSVGSVIVMFFLTKIIGKKQVSQLNLFDYINGITIGSIAAEMATSLEYDFLKPLLAMVIYGVATAAISFFTCKSIKVRNFISGKTIVLYNNGKIYQKNFVKTKLDINEFLVQCRIAGYFNLSDLQTVLIETNGKMSFLPKPQKRPATPEDIKIPVSPQYICSNVIIDGNIMSGVLKQIGKDENWLNKKLKEQNINSTKDILLATYDLNDTLDVFYKNKDNDDKLFFE